MMLRHACSCERCDDEPANEPSVDTSSASIPRPARRPARGAVGGGGDAGKSKIKKPQHARWGLCRIRLLYTGLAGGAGDRRESLAECHQRAMRAYWTEGTKIKGGRGRGGRGRGRRKELSERSTCVPRVGDS